MIYYPARVADKGKMYLGIGAHEEQRKDMLAYLSSLFFRIGLGNGFDIGFDIKSYDLIPTSMYASIRKQFDIKSNIIDGITLDASYSHLFVQEE